LSLTDAPSSRSSAEEPVVQQANLLVPSNFATRFARGDLRHREVMRLHALLVRLSAQLQPPEFAEWLDDLAHWLRSRRALPEQRSTESPASAHLRTLFEALEHLPGPLEHLRAAMTALFSRARAVTLLTDVGLPSRQGFVPELVERLSRSVLPDPPLEDDLGELLTRLFGAPGAVEWFEALSAEESGQLFTLLSLPEWKELAPLQRDMSEAASLLSLRVSHQGLANDVRLRSPHQPLAASPFFKLPGAVRAAVEQLGQPDASAAGDACREVMAHCRKLTKEVEASLEHTGVSVDLVYRLDLIRRQLDRLYALLGLLVPQGGAPPAGAGFLLLLVLIRGARRDRSVTDLLRVSTRLLARRVVDAAAHSGEHYATRSAKELHDLYSKAAGGGAVTAFTAMLKFILGWAGLAPFWAGFSFSLNYIACFVTMQMAGFTLASKQPSMTAAHLARAIDQQKTGELDQLAHEVARVVRSQLAATLGNLGAIVPVVLLLDLGLRAAFGRGLLAPEYADQVIAAHDPLSTALVPGAFCTGVALWVSSIAAGTVENWAVYRHLPEALASHRLVRALLGAERAKRLPRGLPPTLAALGGNVALGLQMGLVPTFLEFFGVSLQLPHVTIATGSVVFAGATRGAEGVLHADFGRALAGIAVVGLLNFGVSFALALFVALRARELGAVAVFQVARGVVRLMVQRPADFFRAPPDEPQPPAVTPTAGP
jgi:site-specific recombinase